MESRTAALLLLIALVALAGCTGTADVTTTADPNNAATTTAQDATATTTETELDPASADLPPGVNASGVENASRLLSAHREALAQSGYRFQVAANTSVRDGYSSQSVSRGVVAEGITPFRLQSESETRMGNQSVHVETDAWGNESVVLTQYSVENRTRYRKQDASLTRPTDADAFGSIRTMNVAGRASQSHVVRFALLSGGYEVADVVARNGTTLTTLRATSFNRSFGDDLGNRSHYDSTLVVDERGRVHRLDTTLRAEQMSVTYDFEITEFGDVSVEYPSWAEQALEIVNARITVDSNDSYFVVSNEEGDVLPAGSEIRTTHAGVNATLELSDPLAPGEQMYVSYPDDDDGQPVLTAEPPAESTVTELRGEYEFVVVDPNGNSLLNAGFGFGSASAPATTGDDGSAAGDGKSESSVPGGTTTTASE